MSKTRNQSLMCCPECGHDLGFVPEGVACSECGTVTPMALRKRRRIPWWSCGAIMLACAGGVALAGGINIWMGGLEWFGHLLLASIGPLAVSLVAGVVLGMAIVQAMPRVRRHRAFETLPIPIPRSAMIVTCLSLLGALPTFAVMWVLYSVFREWAGLASLASH